MDRSHKRKSTLMSNYTIENKEKHKKSVSFFLFSFLSWINEFASLCVPALPLQTESQSTQNGGKSAGKDSLTSEDSAVTDLSPKSDSSPKTETKTDASCKTDASQPPLATGSSPQPKKGAVMDVFGDVMYTHTRAWFSLKSSRLKPASHFLDLNSEASTPYWLCAQIHCDAERDEPLAKLLPENPKSSTYF